MCKLKHNSLCERVPDVLQSHVLLMQMMHVGEQRDIVISDAIKRRATK